jgi:hypothetical protein
MSLKDKLEIGLKPDAPYRKDNLPEFQQDEAVDATASPRRRSAAKSPPRASRPTARRAASARKRRT